MGLKVHSFDIFIAKCRHYKTKNEGFFIHSLNCVNGGWATVLKCIKL